MSRRKITFWNNEGKSKINNNFKDLYDDVATAQAAAEAAQASASALAQIFEASVTLTNAQVLALRGTPITIVAAPGAGYVLEVISAEAFLDYTAAYTESADNIAIRYENGSGAQLATIETTGFLTATADTMAQAVKLDGIAAKTAAENKALVLHNNGDGEFGGGNAANTVTVRVLYRKVAVGW